LLKRIDENKLLEKAVFLIGKKFDLLIIDSINHLNGRARFNEISKGIPSINPRILSMRLKEFEKNKLITKNIILGEPVKIEYALTPKAKELIEIINKLKNWAK
jgi:DNA-binding HxlR family transcriptional regulator